MSLKCITSLASAATLAFVAQATDVAVVESNPTNWFTEAVSGYTGSSVTNGAGVSGTWTVPSGADATIATDSGATGSVVELDADQSEPLVFDPTAGAPTADRYRVTAKVKAVMNTVAPEVYSGTLPLGSLTPVDGSWYAWHRTAANAGEWLPMTGATPSDGAWYDLTMEFKTNAVRYLVGPTALMYNESEWLTNAGTDPLSPSGNVAFAGNGKFQDFGVVGFSTFELAVTTEQLAAAGIVVEGEGTEAVSAALSATGANGLKNWESIVLGLNASDPNSKPYTAPVQTADGSKLGFTIGNVDLSKYASGATVTFQVFDDGDVSSDVTSAGGVAYMDVDSSKVKRYRVKITITK